MTHFFICLNRLEIYTPDPIDRSTPLYGVSGQPRQRRYAASQGRILFFHLPGRRCRAIQRITRQSPPSRASGRSRPCTFTPKEAQAVHDAPTTEKACRAMLCILCLGDRRHCVGRSICPTCSAGSIHQRICMPQLGSFQFSRQPPRSGGNIIRRGQIH